MSFNTGEVVTQKKKRRDDDAPSNHTCDERLQSTALQTVLTDMEENEERERELRDELRSLQSAQYESKAILVEELVRRGMTEYFKVDMAKLRRAL